MATIAPDNTHRGCECLLGTDALYLVRPLLEAAAHFVWQELAETVAHVDLGHLWAAVAVPQVDGEGCARHVDAGLGRL